MELKSQKSRKIERNIGVLIVPFMELKFPKIVGLPVLDSTVLIVPFMELKYFHPHFKSKVSKSLNRTFYGIEIETRPNKNPREVCLNRTFYGIEIN